MGWQRALRMFQDSCLRGIHAPEGDVPSGAGAFSRDGRRADQREDRRGHAVGVDGFEPFVQLPRQGERTGNHHPRAPGGESEHQHEDAERCDAADHRVGVWVLVRGATAFSLLRLLNSATIANGVLVCALCVCSYIGETVRIVNMYAVRANLCSMS